MVQWRHHLLVYTTMQSWHCQIFPHWNLFLKNIVSGQLEYMPYGHKAKRIKNFIGSIKIHSHVDSLLLSYTLLEKILRVILHLIDKACVCHPIRICCLRESASLRVPISKINLWRKKKKKSYQLMDHSLVKNIHKKRCRYTVHIVCQWFPYLHKEFLSPAA